MISVTTDTLNNVFLESLLSTTHLQENRKIFYFIIYRKPSLFKKITVLMLLNRY